MYISTRYCEKCNVEIALTPNAWRNHIKNEAHLENETDNSRKLCKIYNLEIEAQSWFGHLKSNNHLENDRDQTNKLLGFASFVKNVM